MLATAGVTSKMVQTVAKPGEYYLIQKEDEEVWPGVVCDEEMVVKYFEQKNRPNNAKQPEVTWSYKPPGATPGQNVYPMLYMGSLIRCWVPWNYLKSLNGNEIAIRRIFEKNDVLRSAYKDFYWKRDLNFWKARLRSTRLVEKTKADNEPTLYNTGQKRGRDDTTNLYPIQKHKEVGLGDRVTSTKDLNESHTKEYNGSYQYRSKKMKRVQEEDVRESAKYHETSLQDSESENTESENAESEDTDYNAGSSSAEPSGARLKYAGPKDAEPEGVPSKGPVKHLQQETSNTQFLKHPRASLVTTVKPREKIGSEEVRIYVGNPYGVFVVKYQCLQQSTFFLNCIRTQQNERYIMHPVLSEVKISDFGSIAEYLNLLEFKPKLLHEGTDHAELENIKSYEDVASATILCGNMYSIAQRLELPGLQNLCFRKLKALGELPAKVLVLVTKLMFSDWLSNDRLVRDYFVEYVATRYFAIWREEWRGFLTLLEAYTELAMAVHERLGRGAREEEKVVKEEEEKMVKKEE